MKKLSSLLTCLLILLICQAQTDSSLPVNNHQKRFSVAVKTLDNKTMYGQFYSINDSQLVLVKSSRTQLTVPAENIRSFSMKRKGSVLKGALIGLGVGVLTGVVIGFASGDDPIQQPSPDDLWGIGAAFNNAFAMTAGEKALAGGIILGTGGTVVGLIIGAIAKKKFTIGGRKEKFRDLQAEMMKKLVKK